MTSWLLSLIAGPNSIFLLLGGAIIAFFAHGARQRAVGARKEREKQAAAEKRANDIHSEVQNDIGSLPGSKAREELGTWDR